jgi:N-acetylglutamate synthase-like GNAT family acetyltransferase
LAAKRLKTLQARSELVCRWNDSPELLADLWAKKAPNDEICGGHTMKSKSSHDIDQLRLVLNPSELDLAKVVALLDSVGMQPRKLRQMRRAVSASSDVVAAYVDKELVGFGRMISDCVYYGTIWDVAVQPDKQRVGIGTRIMTLLLRRAKQHKLYMIGLFTASHNRTFYEKLGFKFFNDVHAMTCLQKQHD